MRTSIVVRWFVVAALGALAGNAPVWGADHQHAAGESKPVGLLPGLGEYHYPISTKNPEAQKFFDQGLRLVYGFNHEEAIRAFRRAAELDPDAAMPYWGIAYALGPNINLDVDPEREKAAYEAVREALQRAKNASENERTWIEALAKRYSIDPDADLKKLARDFAEAMGELTRRFPDDLDAATLYAESLMNLNPWKLWTADGKPNDHTETIVAVLESVLRRNPQHPGANHYYVHAVEASPQPEKALASAGRLETLVPGAGHLVHMPAHIYMRTGDYERAARANEIAARTDEVYLEASSAKGIYPLMYYTHNLHFLAAAAAMAGRLEEARKAADRVLVHVGDGAKKMQMIEFVVPMRTFVELRFARWDDVLKLPEPDGDLKTTTALWHFARGAAYAAQKDVKNAEREREAFKVIRKAVPEEHVFGYNTAAAILGVAAEVFDARIAAARGEADAAIGHWQKAVEAQDGLSYDEPPDWYYPVRESLGAALLAADKPAEAEKVFREDLERNPRNGRSLFGLMESLEAQNKPTDAEHVRAQFEAAWKTADVKLRIEDL